MSDRLPPPKPAKGQPVDYEVEAGSDGEGEYTEEKYQPCIIRYITALARTWGLITVIVVWVLTALMLRDIKNHKYSPWYTLGLSIVLTFFEFIWIFNKCVVNCRKRNIGCHQCEQKGCCCVFWQFLVWIDNWRKTFLYVIIAIPCFIKEIITTETIICGLMLLVAAVWYFTKSFKESTCVSRKRRKHAYVQTATPTAKLVAHAAQYGQQDPPPDYHACHTASSRVQPKDRGQRSRLSSTQSIDRADDDGRSLSRSGTILDPQGRKRQRYADPNEGDMVVAEPGDNVRASRDSLRSEPDPQEYRDRRRQDRKDRDRSPERYGRDRDDRDRHYERNRDRSPDRYDREYDRDRDKKGFDRDRDRSPDRYDSEYDRDKDYYRDKKSYERDRDRSPDRYIKRQDSSHRRRNSGGSSRSSKPGSHSSDSRSQSLSPSRKMDTVPQKEPPKPQPAPAKVVKEPPPLKELPHEASVAMRESAAAKLVKQSGGSPVLPPGDTAHSKMPDKIEKKVVLMKNPYDTPTPGGKNPFEEDMEEDEYFD